MSTQGVKISELPTASGVTASDLVPVVAGGVTKQATVAQVKDAIKLTLVSEAGSQVTVSGSLLATNGSASVLLQNGTLTADEIYGAVFASGLSIDSGQPISMDNGDIEGARGIDAQTLLLTGKLTLGVSGPTISAGSAAPSSSEPDGSLYLRTTGQLYLRTGGSWVEK